MSAPRTPVAVALFCVLLAVPLLAQAPPAVPRMFWFTGVVRDASGQPRTGPTPLLFAIYMDAEGGVPLAQELQYRARAPLVSPRSPPGFVPAARS